MNTCIDRVRGLSRASALQPLLGLLAVVGLVAAPLARAQADDAVQITVRVDQPTVELGPTLYGLFFEDINFAADGGLYAELVQNRSFEYYGVEGWNPLSEQYRPLTAWEQVARENAEVELAVIDDKPLNDKNTKYLEAKITRRGVAGVANTGYNGIHLDAGAGYNVSVYAKMEDWLGDKTITVALELADGTVLGSVSFDGLNRQWQQFKGEIKPSQTTDDARLVVTTTGRGTLSLDMVSLFPQDTYKGRANGLRPDLVQALADLNPRFLRFPGGCISHGWGIDNMYQWKDSVGDPAERKPNWNLWGYHQTYGLGFYEYFLLCEDLGMEALPVVPAGVSCGFRGLEAVAMADLHIHIDHALDLIEFANGPADSEWGKVRAEMGHPEPFNIKYICLGNEDHDTPEFRERIPHFVKAVQEKHPEIKVIGTSGLSPSIPLYDDMAELHVHSSDEHYYMSPDWFIQNQNRFDEFDRNGPKVFVGEYASEDNRLYNAVAEAAYLTGIERNADIVEMTCYAPLFAREDATQWTTDLIFFNKRSVLRTPNYYVQQLFGQNKGDVYLSNTVTRQAQTQQEVAPVGVGVGSWNTAIEVESLKVNGEDVDPENWQTNNGEFAVQDGRYVQTDRRATPAISTSTQAYGGKTVTYEARVRATAGQEGFLLRFGTDKDGRGGYWWNVGGWGNTQHAIEQINPGGGKSTVTTRQGRIEYGRWYDARIELAPGSVKCYLDDRLVHDVELASPKLSLSPTLDKAANQVILKLVNPTDEAIKTTITLAGVTGVAETAKLTTLTGERQARNTFDNPDRVSPVDSEIAVSGEFEHTVPAMSVQFIRVQLD